MSTKLQAIRGMNDCLPGQTQLWQHVEKTIQQIINHHGYNEIRFPIVEMTGLFKRAIGEVTDVVEKEMYTFDDRNHESLTLRPEGTAGCVRAGIENGLFYNQEQRLWYIGPMFRYEKPQKGRYRQFHQIGVEVFGIDGPWIDAELIAMTARFWKALGFSDHVTLQLNSIGSLTARNRYKQALYEYLSDHKDALDPDSLRRLETNPLRILDSKESTTQNLLENAPVLTDYLDPESIEHFNKLCEILNKMGLSYEINPRLVRGLDYYNDTVFEWVTTALGAQGSICGGGRYDSLVEQMGGKETPAVGFAMGIERLVLLIETLSLHHTANPVDIYLLTTDQTRDAGLIWLEQFRTEAPQFKIMPHQSGGALKRQFKWADKSGATYAFILGEDELASHQLTVKNLINGQQVTLFQHELLNYLLNDQLNVN